MGCQGREGEKDAGEEEKQGWRQQEKEMTEKEEYNVSSNGPGQTPPAGE